MSEKHHIEQWNKCLEIFKDNLSAEQFNAWFAPIVAVDFTDDKLTLNVPSQFFVEQIEERFYGLLKATIKRVFGQKTKLFYNYNIVKDDQESSVTLEDDGPSTIVGSKQAMQSYSSNPFDTCEYSDIDPQLNPRYTFENYCDSMSNKLAVSIGQTIATDPNCKTFNPLFVFGSTGVGKTHLIQAIGIKIKERNPRTRVLYVTARLFEH